MRDKTIDGPALYQRDFELPSHWAGRRVMLEAHAISYHASVRVNGKEAGQHQGMWSPFQLDVTALIRPGENALEIEVWKPGARFPPRAVLGGFLPDVCTTFGGIWQDIGLRAWSGAAFRDLRVVAEPQGSVLVTGGIEVEAPTAALSGRLRLLQLRDAEKAVLAEAAADISESADAFSGQLALAGAAPWAMGGSASSLRVEILLEVDGQLRARAVKRVPWRALTAVGGRTLLNGAPVHLRGVLDWGWDANTIAPSSRTLRHKVRTARALGFNLLKLCLFVPDELTFEIADEEGMALWLEMPMWLPSVTSEFKALALREYRDIFRRAHGHPSLVIVSLGCELNAQADAEFLGALHALARAWLPGTLICDNSGSAEAYGGVATTLSDFYDYHFYTDPHFFEPLVQHFERAHRARKPWIYGEFCDADTLRDFGALEASSVTWWLTDPVPLEREDFLATRDYRSRLAAAHVTDGGARLTQIARRQATAVRKYVLERVRAHSATGGYVVTGWADTPITTSGVVDDAGQPKFSPDEWRAFNADRVLVLERERRRRWVGGDRPAHRDPHTWWQGEPAELHLILSNGGETIERARLRWRLTRAQGEPIAGGESQVDAVPEGEVVEMAALSVHLPPGNADAPDELTLTAELVQAASRPDATAMDSGPASVPFGAPALAQGEWRLWAVPRPRLPETIACGDDLRHRHPFASFAPQVRMISADDGDDAVIVIASELTAGLLRSVGRGRRALLWQQEPDTRFTRALPFWREAIHVFEPHPWWDSLPHPGHADIRFFSLATDIAIDAPSLLALMGQSARGAHVWRRFDARALTWAEYVVDVRLGSGRLLVTSLRLSGGLGAQPEAFATNPWGAWMLARLLRELMREPAG